MRALLFAVIYLYSLTICNVFAQGTDEEFRSQARDYVTKGNRQYDRSFRNGIQMYADSLELLIRDRSAAGLLIVEDSLEFTADLLKLRADWHYENGNYDNKSYNVAERLLHEAIAIYDTNNSLPKSLNNLPIIHRDMAQLMYKLTRYNDALAYTDQALCAYETAFDNGEFDASDGEYTTFLDLKSQKAMCLARTGATEDALSIMDKLLSEYPKSSEGYYEVLRKKGKILMLSQRPGIEKEALKLYKQYLTWRQSDALNTLGTMTSAEREDYWMRIRPFVADCYQLEDADPGFLYDVTLFSKGLLLQLNRMSGYGVASEQALATLRHTWADVQGALTKDACAIEFVQYEKFGKQLMGAIVMQKSGSPKWVQMMAPDTFYNYKIGTFTNKERLEATKTDTERKRSRLYNDSVFTSEIWTPELAGKVGKAKKIYFAPDGYLQQLAIEYMDYSPFKDAEICRLSSTRRLLEDSKVKSNAALIVGNVDYNARNIAGTSGNDSLAFEHVTRLHVNFGNLKDSDLEIQAMSAIRNCPSDTLLYGDFATEQNFMDLCNRYPLIIVSTHGYFDEAHIVEGSDIKTNRTDESLSHSLLALSGINMNTENVSFDRGLKDGILSSREISETNMDNVDIAILSACQTGLGYITSDGVFGIQRGFKNAGVDVLVVSLWEVDNAATQLLMLSFLKYMNEGITTHKAFSMARRVLSDNDEAQAERVRLFGQDCNNPGLLTYYDGPYYQDAFIMIDAVE